MKCTNLSTKVVPERKERERGMENVSEEIVVESSQTQIEMFPIQVLEAQRVLQKMNPNRATPRQI